MSPQRNLQHLNQIQPYHKDGIYVHSIDMKCYSHTNQSYISDDSSCIKVVEITKEQTYHWYTNYLGHTGECPLWIQQLFDTNGRVNQLREKNYFELKVNKVGQMSTNIIFINIRRWNKHIIMYCTDIYCIKVMETLYF